MFCTNCGTSVAPGSNNCHNCGKAIENSQQMNSMQPDIQQTNMMPNNNQMPMQNQPINNGVSGGSNNNGNNKTILIIIIVVVAVVGLLGIGGAVVVGSLLSDGDLEDVEEVVEEVKDENREKNFVFKEEVKLNGGDLLLIYENKNNEALQADLELEFYDANKQPLGTSTEFAFVPAKSEAYFLVYDFNLKKGYASYEKEIDVPEHSSLYEFVEIKDLKTNDNGEEIIVQYTNNTGKKIDNLEVMLLFYKDNKIVFADRDSEYDVEKGKNANFEFSYYFEKEYEGLQFDKYKAVAVGYNNNY